MADDHIQRSFRANPMPTQDAPGAGRKVAPAGNDPLAELARLIGQNDPFAEYGRQNAPAPARQQPARVNPEWAAHVAADVAADAGYIPPPAAPPPQHPAYAVPESHPAEYVPSAAEYVPGAYPQNIPGYAGGEGGYEPESHYPNVPLSDEEHHDFYDEAPPRRRMGILAIAAVFALAVIGTAGAFGYRALFGSSGTSGPPPVIKADTTPNKVAPAKKKSADNKNGKLIYDRVADRGQGEKLVSREEQPVDIKKPAAGMLPHEQEGIASGSIHPELGSGVVGATPRKIHTIAIRPDGTAVPTAAHSNTAPAAPPLAAPPASAPTEKPMAPAPHEAAAKPAPAPAPQRAVEPPTAPAPHRVTTTHVAPPARRHVAASRNAPLSLDPNAPAPTPAAPAARRAPVRHAPAAPTQLAPRQTARAPVRAAPAAHGGYAVQVASRHNEADARASLRSLQAKFPQQLGGHQTMIRRVDLGAKGIYYRAMFGPFASSEAASHMCSQLKAAGGNCFIQRI